MGFWCIALCAGGQVPNVFVEVAIIVVVVVAVVVGVGGGYVVIVRRKNLIKTFTWYYDYVSMVHNYLKHRYGTTKCVQNEMYAPSFFLSFGNSSFQRKEKKICTKDGIVNKHQIKVFIVDFYL